MNKNITKKIMIGVCAGVIGLGSATYGDLDKLSISGNILGGLNHLKLMEGDNKNKLKRSQFDFAANIDFDYEISDKISGTFQLQTGPGNGSLGIVGPGAELTDISVSYTPKKQLRYTLGSFDTPFGQHIGSLSNNADTFNNQFIANSLLYDVFAGPVGTLNTLGIMGEINYEQESIQYAITNGTREDAANSDGSFEYVISAQTTRLLSNLSLGLGYMNDMGRKDEKDEKDEFGIGFGVDFEAGLFDFDYTINNFGGIKGYVGSLKYGDNNDATKDVVTTWMLESYCVTEAYDFGLSVSQWLPNNKDGNGDGANLPNVGFGRQSDGTALTITDQAVTRFQVGVTRKLEENVHLKTEILFDDYAKSKSDTLGIFSFVNIKI